MAAQEDKILISDEITEKEITFFQWNHRRSDETCDYPFVNLEDGSRFYYNRFLFL